MYRKWRHSGPAYRYTYISWCSMICRCTSPETQNYPAYGGRGITVTRRWKNFDNFVDDMGVRPLGLTLDRINNDGNYSKRNCRWATIKEQAHNRRTNHRVTYAGRTRTITAWAEILNVSKVTLHSYIRRRGPERAIARYLAQMEL